MHKDLQLVSSAAHDLGVPLPIAHATKELYGMAAARGLADVDFSGVSEVLTKKRGGVK
jgi:3-hydroxyisobutyrate dehydrogenase-like beta-hydroxyacid dehydrogenase